ncbi:MAG: hypothetical protein AAGU77_08440 [Bacillota bacterium]
MIGFNSNCTICGSIIKYFRPHNEHEENWLNHRDAFCDYRAAVSALRQLVENEEVEFLAGNCPLSDIEEHIEREDLYTINHYFRCKCGQIYYLGFCCRGMPLCQLSDTVPINKNYWDGQKFGSWHGLHPEW